MNEEEAKSTTSETEDSARAAIIAYVRVTHHLIIGARTARLLEEETEAGATHCEIKGRDVESDLPRNTQVELSVLSAAIAGNESESGIAITSAWYHILKKHDTGSSQDAVLAEYYKRVRCDVEKHSGISKSLLRLADFYWSSCAMTNNTGFDPDAFHAKVWEEMGVDSREMGQENPREPQGV